MTCIFTSDLLRPWLLPALEAADICLLCSASRSLRKELKLLPSFSVTFRRDVLMSDDAIISLAATIRGMLSLTHLSIGVAYQACSSVSKLAECLAGLQLAKLTVDARRCNLGDQGVRAWTKALACLMQNTSKLVFLHLRLSFNRISSKGALDLAKVFENGCVQLKDVILDVDINPIADSAFLLLQSLRTTHRLRVDMAHCDIGDVVAVKIACLLNSAEFRDRNPDENPNPVVYGSGKTLQFRSLQELLELTELQDELSSQEIFESLRHLTDPEHPNLSLEQLKVVEAGHVWVNEATRTVFVRFTPTVPTCSVATLIGLTIKAKLLRSLPHRYKVDVEITPGTHNTEDQVNKQLADKERVAAALENPALRNLINNGIAGTDKPDASLLLA
ncbi:Cytosolic iron-sulfur assembly component 2B (MSS19-interacting protein of 18 kDa) (Mitotic spindle-associated MMXD complex subunit MIP18) (Protein FAM96B) [Durusdinium trenchii]|uniref:Cytosolic iron-sulfur assembly component 2B (MSS19-interacting protein of 18 kDa) (Mitotic spindle-associated MMXD complex subunit MIP18) (Protein FAM96B) n=1 Tax=Durusdinium trenchii TaxID=1381693 RepID=A0ABP0M3Z7_9DINO